MRGQQPGMPQPRPRQQSGLGDMQLWQRQLMFQQLKEFQRQKQLQQHQSPMNQMSDIANSTPIHDVPNNLWSNDLTGGHSKVPSSSQMFMTGNMNWVPHGGSSAVQGFPNGLVFSHEQGQGLRSMGLVPQLLDQSLYGVPITSTRDVFNQYSHIQGISQDSTNLLTRASGNQLQKPIAQLPSFNSSFQGDQSALFPDPVSMQDGALVSKQGFQGKNFFEHVPFQGLNSVVQVSSSLGLVSLDPIEEKILFNSDGNIWDCPIDRSGTIGTGGYGNSLESEYLTAFPSIQNGTWSALMQSAVAEASSSDTGLQEEWSGLSFQKTELSTENQPASLSDSGKQHTDWADNSLQSASSLTSRPFPLQKPLVEESQVQPSMHLENASQGAWAGQIYEQSESAAHSMDVELNAQNMRGSWVDQHSMSAYNIDRQPSSRDINECGDANFNDHKIGIFMESDHDGGMFKADGNRVENSFPNFTDGFEQVKSGIGRHHVDTEASHFNNFTVLPNSGATKVDQEIDKQVPKNHHSFYGKNVVDSSVKYRGDESGGKYHRQMSPQKEISNDSYCSNQSHPSVSGGGLRENSWLNGSESRPSDSGNQNYMGQIDQKASGSRKFQYHPMGNSGVESSNPSFVHQQHDQSATSQGFGLRLATPQRLPASNHALALQNSSQRVTDLNSRHSDSNVGQKSQTWLAPTSGQSLHSHELSQRQHLVNNLGVSGETGYETSHSNMQANIFAAFKSASSYSSNQLQSQHMPISNGLVMANHSANISYDKLINHNGVVADRSAQVSLPGTASRIPPFNLAPLADTSQPIDTNSTCVRVSGQQFPVLESVPVSKPSAMSGKSQQGAFSTMLHNAWTNLSTQQHLTSGSPHKFSPNFSQSINPSNSNPQKPGDQDFNKGGNAPEFGACSVNSQSTTYGKEKLGKESSWQLMPTEEVDPSLQTSGASQGQESVLEHLPNKNFISYGSLVAHPRQQGLVPVSQTENLLLQNPATLNRDIEAFGRSLKQSHLLHKKYSLLHQMQSMKGVEIDPDKRGMKRFRGADSAPDVQQETARAGQQLFDGYNMIIRDVDNELNAATRNTSFSPKDSKMLSFSSEGREYQNAIASQNHSVASVIPENPQVNPQMAPSWFEQYGTVKNGQMLPMYDARRTVKNAAQPFFFGKDSESLHPHISSDQVNAFDASQVGSACQRTITTLVSNECLSPPQSLPSDITDQSLALVRPKKRKTKTLELLPWHKEVTNGSQRLETISMADQDWADAANRLYEVEDEAEIVEDGQTTILQPRKRLILTTQLMQQLLSPAPSAIFSAEVTSDYESVTYFVAKFTLGEACSLSSYSRSDLHLPIDNGNTASGKLKTLERVGNQYFSEVVEDFIDKARKLETDLLRFEKRASILDIRVECQDLERFSIFNRFAKFHARSQADGADASSSDAAATKQKTCPQRYVTALALPRNLPHGVQCLSL